MRHALVLLAMSLTVAAVEEPVRLITLDPGHFHAALVQKTMYEQVDPAVHVFAPAGPDVDAHLKRIADYNNRADKPTRWKLKVHTGPDFMDRFLAEKPGNLLVLSGNNARKTEYILKGVEVGLNVLADKPMAITPADFEKLKQAFAMAAEKRVLLYDIMTERYEVTTRLQRELSRQPELFGELEQGSADDPAVTKESVHHFSKLVSGKPLVRPAWFFDTSQQGEGIVDVTTHLVDLIHWECFPEQTLDGPRDVKVLSARRWPTEISPAQFTQATQLEVFPEFLKKDVGPNGALQVFCNGEFTYTLKGVHAKVSVRWNFEAPPGGSDTHYSLLRGTKSALIIRQGAEQQFKPSLYVEPRPGADVQAVGAALGKALEQLKADYPGLESLKTEQGWEIITPAELRIGHEAHFAEVARKYLGFLDTGAMPAWEVPNMIAKYHTIMEAYRLSR